MLFGTDEDVPPQTDIVAELNAVAERGGRSEFQLTGRHRDGTESVRQLVIKRCELDGERYLLAVIAASTDENRYKNTLAKMSERLQELATAESPSEIYRPRYYSSNALFCESATTVYAA